jgi:formylglycine-generating enzyme required for sulfatase activity
MSWGLCLLLYIYKILMNSDRRTSQLRGRMSKALKIFFLGFLILGPSQGWANNLAVSNVSLGERNTSAKTVAVQFNVSWQNSWRTKINHDAVWLTVRLYNPTSNPTNKKLCQISASGLNPQNTSVGSNSSLELYVPSDRFGTFLRPATYGLNSSVSSTSVKLTVNYDSCGFSDSETVYASVFGMEMVYVPEGAFYAGDNAASTASLVQGTGDTEPWYVSSENAINTTNAASDSFVYVSGNNASEDAGGTAFTIAADFPKGYKPLYVMKYELTEGDWVEFINSLSSDAARNHRDLTDSSHKNSDSVINRNTISCSGTPLSCTTARPARALGYLTWQDLTAFLDWAALRPISELEFEKTARGPILSISNEFAWGSTTINAATTISGGSENGAETVESAANANFGNNTLTGGDTTGGAEYTHGPLRTGIFASTASDRDKSGAGYYGAMELSGNLKERVVSIGNAAGRLFTGLNGDGILSSAGGFEGNANQAGWPGLDSDPIRGVTSTEGSGLRGGGFDESQNRLRISDRQEAANSLAASSNTGGRGARTYDGN